MAHNLSRELQMRASDRTPDPSPHFLAFASSGPGCPKKSLKKAWLRGLNDSWQAQKTPARRAIEPFTIHAVLQSDARAQASCVAAQAIARKKAVPVEEKSGVMFHSSRTAQVLEDVRGDGARIVAFSRP
jgi:hypothetical protein